MKYRTWLYDWLKLYVKPNVKIRTLNKYENQIRLHINPNIGDYELNELNADILQKFVIDMIDKKLSTNTINSIISIIKSSLKRAVLLGKIEKEYSNAIVRPKQIQKQIECFTREEQKKIEDFVVRKNKQSCFGIVLCLYTGLRIGELLALTWDDINLQKGIMLVTKNSYDSWNNGKYEKVIDTTKTINSQRLIPLPKQLLPTLKEIKKQTKSKYIVAKDKDYGIQIRTYQKFFSNMLKKLNIKHKGFHSLRHTFATRALECGMDIKTLSEILGHKNPTITLKRYAHSLLEHKTEMMNKLGKLFSLY